MRRRAVTPAAALVLLLAGCTAPAAPLVTAMDTTNCFDSALYTEALVGVAIENRGTGGIEIEHVRFPAHKGITVHDVWLVDADPQEDGTTLGYGAEAYPPDVSTRPSWHDRVPAEGATVPAGTSTFLVVRFERTESDSVVDGVNVDYVADGVSYTAESNVRFGFSSTGGDCQ